MAKKVDEISRISRMARTVFQKDCEVENGVELVVTFYEPDYIRPYRTYVRPAEEPSRFVEDAVVEDGAPDSALAVHTKWVHAMKLGLL